MFVGVWVYVSVDIYIYLSFSRFVDQTEGTDDPTPKTGKRKKTPALFPPECMQGVCCLLYLYMYMYIYRYR